MLVLLASLAAAAASPAGPPANPADEIVCKRDKSPDVGTHMRSKRVCMKRSEWEIVEKNTQNQLQNLQDRSSYNPGMADGHRPN
jgi:hypothetical protein